MKKHTKSNYLILPGILLIVNLLVTVPEGHAQDKVSNPQGTVYLEMTKEFYEALKKESQEGIISYSNDLSVEYLKQISISSRFMVETNLQILKQQETIIQLLQSILGKKDR